MDWDAFTPGLFRALAVLTVLTTLVRPSTSQESSVDLDFGRVVERTKLLTLGKTDRWELEDVQAGEFLWCRVVSSEFDPVLSLVGSDGEVLATHDGEGTSSELRLRCPSAGDFSIQVAG